MSERRNRFDRGSSMPVVQSSPESPRSRECRRAMNDPQNIFPPSEIFMNQLASRRSTDSRESRYRQNVDITPWDIHQQGQDRNGAPLYASNNKDSCTTNASNTIDSGKTNVDRSSTCKYPTQAPLSPGAPSSPDQSDQIILSGRTGLHQQGPNSNRICSLPTLPSPLGPRPVRDNYEIGPLDNLVSSTAPLGTSSTPQHRIFSEPKNPHVFGLRQRFGHVRQHTDPFVDDMEVETKAVDASHVTLQATRWFPLPPRDARNEEKTAMFSGSLSARHASFQLNSPRTPSMPESAVGAASQSGVWSSSAPPAAGREFPRALTFGDLSTGSPVAQINPLVQSSFHVRSPLQLPHSVQGQTLDNLTQLEERERIREAWVRHEATKMVQLAKLRRELELRFHDTHALEDYDNWQRVETVLAETTNLDRMQKERRALFLKEKGMVPLITHNVDDMSAANRGAEVDGYEEGKLLGFKMGLMERVCAEVMPERKDGNETTITAQMLDTLNLEERKALREHLVGRLGRLQ